MTNHATRVPLRLTGLAVAAFLLAATPAGVAATTNAPIAATGGMTATLPLLGTSLTVAVTLDAVGNIKGVALDPSTALSKTKSGDDFVKFTNTDGSVKVTVKAMGGQLAIKARAKLLSDLLGTRSWSADVFGTGTPSTAAYTVGKDTSGNPTVKINSVSVSPSAGITWTANPVPAVKIAPKNAKPANKDKGSSAVAGGTFAWQGFTKRLSITAHVAGDGTASLAIILSGRDAQKRNGTLLSLAGPWTWSAHECNGTAVTIKYHVAGGKVVYDGATGATATEKSFANGFMAWFDKGRTGVFVNLVSQANGTYTLLVYGRSGDCGSHKGHAGRGWGFGFGQGFGGHGQWSPPGKSDKKSLRRWTPAWHGRPPGCLRVACQSERRDCLRDQCTHVGRAAG